MLISVEGTSKNEPQPSQKGIGDAAVLSYCPLPNLTGVLEHCELETSFGSPFFGAFSSDRILMYISSRM